MTAQPRCVALVGPFQSGKTALFEAILHRAGAADRRGVGDQSPEARAHGLSVEANVATCAFLGETYTFVDCPGSVEFRCAASASLPVCDAAVVVCEADEKKIPALEMTLRELEALGVPHLLFLNKVDVAAGGAVEALAALQKASRAPLLLRQLPMIEDGQAVGFIDLALERAFVYRDGAESEVVELPSEERDREKDERFHMLERLADHDDKLMEDLIMEVEPERRRIFADLASELRGNQAVSVLLGSALREHGVTRLLKALRHEAPGVGETRVRLGLAADGPPLAYAIKTQHPGFGGKVTVARVLRGAFKEGDTVVGAAEGESRIGGLVTLVGEQSTRKSGVREGEVAGFLRLDAIATGEPFSVGAAPAPIAEAERPPCVHAVALKVRDRKDDVRLSAALTRLVEEDPSLVVEHLAELNELRLSGQGEMHLRCATERLASRYQVAVASERPSVGYRETIKGPASAHGRHKKQSGGHGQFGDVRLEIRPLARGAGVVFEDRIVGGAVPRQYIPSVEAGVRAWAERGPLGFPVVDFAATLVDGSYHTVDSSDAAFQAAARLAMNEAAAAAGAVLLEPILHVTIIAPSSATAGVTQLVAGRRGQILGYDARPGWDDWIALDALLPEAEIDGLVIQLRSATTGVGGYTFRFEKMAELAGPAADAARERELTRKAG